MRKASKIMLIVWDILLIPNIIAAISFLTHSFDLFPPMEALPTILQNLLLFLYIPFAMLAAYSQYFIPQIITLVLIVLNFTMPFRFWEPTPSKKDITQRVLLSIFAVIGAICAFISVLMLSDGKGVPIS